MKMIFSYSRKIRVPIPGDNYNSNEYFHSLTVEYNEEDLEKETILENKEFERLEELIDEVQREVIKKEMKITKLPMDKIEDKPKLKGKFKTPKKIKW